MNRYMITRQEVNLGPTRTIYTATRSQAEHAFDVALEQGASFVEIFDMENDCQVRVEIPQSMWV